LSDRVGPRNTLFASLGAMGLAMLALPLIGSLWGFYAFAAVFGVAYGGAFISWTRLPAELFGLAAAGALMGLLSTGTNLGGAAGSYTAGYIFDLTGSYSPAFLAGAALLLFASGMAVFLNVPRRGVQEANG
ncbi:MAG: MFS transporter, partial [Chloroflexota bacterium]